MPLRGNALFERRKFAEQFTDYTVADRIRTGDTGAYFDNISAEDVMQFLLKKTYELLPVRPRVCCMQNSL